MLDGPVATIAKNSREDVRVSLTTFKGHRLVDVRVYADAKAGGRVATQKGVSVRLDTLPALIEGLEAARAAGGE